MSNGGDHRNHSLARLLATPFLLAVAVLIGFAVYRGDVLILRVAAVLALAVGVTVVLLFDRELVHARRDHGADRASLARSYMTMYAARVRDDVETSIGVTLPLTSEELAETAEAEAVAMAVAVAEAEAESVEVAEAAPVAEDAVVAEAAEPSEDVAAADPDGGDANGIASPLPVVVEVGRTAAQTETPELWENLRDAPTVVDLIAFEERAKLAELIAADEAAEKAKQAAENDKPPAAEETA